MKFSRKLIAFFLTALMLLSLAGCSDSSKELVGTWESQTDIMPQMLEELKSNSSTAEFCEYIEMEEFIVELTLVFNEDGTYSMTIEQESFTENLLKLLRECISGYLYDYFETYFASYGLTGSVDEILASVDMDMDSLIDTQLSYYDMDELASLSDAFCQSGNYSASNGKLYRSDGVDSVSDPQVYEPYILEGDTLTLTDYINNGESESAGYPIVFTRVA